MLLSLGGEFGSNAEQAAALGLTSVPVQYSAQISVVTPASPDSDSTSTSVSVSLLPSAPTVQNADVRAESLRRLASNGAMTLSIVSHPAIFLRDQDGNILSSLDGPPSSNEVYTGIGGEPPAESGPTTHEQYVLDEQAKELTPEGLALLPKVPWALDTSIKGSLSPDRGWMSFKVPVGPSTNTLRLAVSPDHGDSDSFTAMVDQMYLVGANGEVIAALTGVATFEQGSRQTLIITLQSAPAGAVLVIRMVQPNADPPATPGDGDSTDATNSGDGLGALTPPPATNGFEVDINRDDSAPQSPGAPSDSSTVVIPPGTYLPTTPGAPSNHFGVSPGSNGANATSINFDPGYASNSNNWTASIGGARASIDSLDVDPQSESVSLGPLVSRGSAPMGPALATSIDDPAPSINRDDQGGGDSAVQRVQGEDGELVLKLRLGGDADRTAARRLDPQDAAAEDDLAPLTTLKGLGGLPLLVASFRRQGTSHADELAATLRQSADGLVPADETLPISATDLRNERDEIAKAGIATRAVGFIIALGLATGPLYPDLVALARRRLARKRRGGSPTVATTARRLFRRRSPWSIS